MSAPTLSPFSSNTDPPVRGFLHLPPDPNGEALLLTHGAGANCQSKLLIAVADAFAAAGLAVLRFDLPFRIDRLFGPPRGNAARDRSGLRRAVTLIKQQVRGRVFLGGHSYGGRQATMLLAEDPQIADGLLLLSYPLHPPEKPAQLRTSHFPQLRTPGLFIHGTRDPFGSPDEMNAALALIPAPHRLLHIDGAAHDLLLKKVPGDLPARVLREFQAFFNAGST